MKHSPRPGDRVAHRSLEDPEGAARSGVAVDVVGDEKQSVVIVESEGGREAFDTREMLSLGSSGQSSGPVILRPAHLKSALRRRQRIMAIITVVVLLGSLVVSALVLDLSLKALFMVASGILVLGMAMIIMLERDAQRESRNPEDR